MCSLGLHFFLRKIWGRLKKKHDAIVVIVCVCLQVKTREKNVNYKSNKIIRLNVKLYKKPFHWGWSRMRDKYVTPLIVKKLYCNKPSESNIGHFIGNIENKFLTNNRNAFLIVAVNNILIL